MEGSMEGFWKAAAEGWRDAASAMAENAKFYRDLLHRTAAILGEEAYRADDGVIHADPFVSKVPEIVARMVVAKRFSLKRVRGRGDVFQLIGMDGKVIGVSDRLSSLMNYCRENHLFPVTITVADWEE